MRHRVYGSKLGRNKDERRILFKGLLSSLLSYGSLETSETKAKAIKGLVDKVINLAKDKNTQHLLQSYINDKSLRERVIKEITPKLSDRVSGYTKLIRMGIREGDQTTIVRMSLINNEELKSIERESRIKNQELRKETKNNNKTTKKENTKVVTKDKPTRRKSKKP